MSNDDNKGGGFWSQVFSALEKLAILYLVICLFERFIQWSVQSKIKCWVFWSVLCTVGSFVVLGCGIAFVAELTDSHPQTHPWYLTIYFLASAISGMVWAAIFVESKFSKDFPKDRSSLAGCCVVGIALLIPSTILLGKWFDGAYAAMWAEDRTVQAEPVAVPHSRLWLRFPNPVSDDLLMADNYAIIAHPPGRAAAPVRIFRVNRMGDSIVELETGYIPRQAAQTANEINLQLSSNLVARAGMAEVELK